MTDIMLRTIDPLVRARLEPYIDQLRAEGYEVEMNPPDELRYGQFSIDTLVIAVAVVILDNEYPKIKRFLKVWFTELPPTSRRHLRRLPVRVENEHHELFDHFVLGDDEDEGDE
ncbi:MAG: hypothetical protein H0U53_10100 [Actinobacteria bacterium]|nr:hypothetical protein [Actinomycetota bacterium]